MLLSTPLSSDLLSLTATAPTVVAPGTRFDLTFKFTALQALTLRTIHWEIPTRLAIEIDAAEEILPYTFEAGDTYEAALNVYTQEEGYGEMQGIFILEQINDDGTVETISMRLHLWLSVFERKMARAAEGLQDELRHRLIEVVNVRDRNGHIFLANFGAFFDDFLHIEIPHTIANLIGEELGLPVQNLPLDPEIYLETILGTKRFYGIEKLELIAEEECVESDDRFDPDDAREVSFIDLNNE